MKTALYISIIILMILLGIIIYLPCFAAGSVLVRTDNTVVSSIEDYPQVILEEDAVEIEPEVEEAPERVYTTYEKSHIQTYTRR